MMFLQAVSSAASSLNMQNGAENDTGCSKRHFYIRKTKHFIHTTFTNLVQSAEINVLPVYKQEF